jgi:NAD(P)-dependent dehydrogenase (short-subunit alcohol dehydrogenase family)
MGSEMRLAGKVALVTGGGSGIGEAATLLFAREGARVVVSDYSLSRAADVAQRIRTAGGEVLAVAGDVSVSEDALKMVQVAVDGFGRLDVLVNSAGVTARNALGPDASPEEVWDRVIEVNLKGSYLVSWHAVPEMKRSGGGSIVNLSSIMGLVGYPRGMGGGFNPYPASKGGIVQLTKSLAIDLAPDGIRVNCVCPGFTETRLTEALLSDADTKQTLEARHPMGRLGQPEEIAYAALYLASDEASFVTGTSLAVDGGYTAQ